MTTPLFADRYQLRQATPDDYHNGFFELLGQLTVAPQCDQALYLEIIGDKNIGLWVMEEVPTRKLVATMRLNYERKLIRNGGTVCHFEDFVVDAEHRKCGIGAYMIQTAMEMARTRGCYKMLGICADELMPYYEKQGFKKTGFVFGRYF